MQVFTTSSFLQGVPGVARLAKKSGDSIHSEDRDSYKKIVKYSSVLGDSNSFYVDVLSNVNVWNRVGCYRTLEAATG